MAPPIERKKVTAEVPTPSCFIGTAFCTSCGRPLQEPAADRRRVSVLFIDVVEFTAYAEGADPEQVRAMQNDYFTAVRRVVGQYGGVVEKYIGDAAMALFAAAGAACALAARKL